MIALLLTFFAYSGLSSADKASMTVALWVTAVSWGFAPAMYNPHAFSLKELLADWSSWHSWLLSADFDDWFYGQKAGASVGELGQNNWYMHLNAESAARRLLKGLGAFAFWGGLLASLLLEVAPPCQWRGCRSARPATGVGAALGPQGSRASSNSALSSRFLA